MRERAARAVLAVYKDLGLADLDPQRVEQVVVAYSSKDLSEGDPHASLDAASAILERNMTALDVVCSLARTGFREEAERVLGMVRARLVGDYLQTAAIFSEDMTVLSKITDPNDYQGPGTGYVLSPERREQIARIRQERSTADLLAEQAALAGSVVLSEKGHLPDGARPA